MAGYVVPLAVLLCHQLHMQNQVKRILSSTNNNDELSHKLVTFIFYFAIKTVPSLITSI